MSDVLAVGVLAKVFPPELVDDVIEACGRTELRRRRLPARSVAYLTIGMGLHWQGSYEDVLALVSDGLYRLANGAPAPQLANKAAISDARRRLGPEPLAALFVRAARPMAAPGKAGAFVAGRRLVAVEELLLDVPDTPANAARYDRRAPEELPSVRVVALTECATHAVLAASVAPVARSEDEAMTALWRKLGPRMLCCGASRLLGSEAWPAAARTGAELLWRADGLELGPLKALGDGTWLASLAGDGFEGDDQRRELVRLIDVPGAADDGTAPVRIATTLLDPLEASGELLARVYSQWRAGESALTELKGRQCGPRGVLRSRSPELVEQEIWGHLCCHLAATSLEYELIRTPVR